ncbi:MAG: hypothetical protein NVS1B11_03670 [Terriglobales bacterium]
MHPRYREKLPIDSTLAKTDPGLDRFVTEKYHDQIAAILGRWRLSLLQSPRDMQAMEEALAPSFSGGSLHPVESRVVRSGPVVEVRQCKFGTETNHDRSGFLREMNSSLALFSKIETAEFQIVSIAASDIQVTNAGDMPAGSRNVAIPGHLQTRVQYELVGLGQRSAQTTSEQNESLSKYFREQRIGHWEMEWEASWVAGSPAVSEWRIRKWSALDETQSRSDGPVYVDIAHKALGGNDSYASQLLLGADYWRTVLDGACGIDIYGHNGISVGDIDGDGFDDLYVCQPAGLPNRLYRNRGDGTFEDITEGSGLGIPENTACAIFADFNNTGRQDLIVVRSDGPALFLNEGGGKFRKKPNAFKFVTPPQGTFTGAAVADYDSDGWLDIYFCLYIFYQGAGQYKYPSPYFDAENGPPNFLLRNNRDGTFQDVTAQSGLDKNNTRYSFCCGWGDFHGNGRPDLYVVNDFGRKNLYRNNGDGTFTDIGSQAGVEDIGAGMSVCSLDYDNDGREDLYVANMWTAAGLRISEQHAFQENAPENVRGLYRKHAMGNSLLQNEGTGLFHDGTAAGGVGMGRWSWSSDAWDFDHDGFPDLYITNGMISGPAGLGRDLDSFFWRQVVANSPSEAKPSQEYEQGWNALNELIREDATWSGFERNVFYANNRDGTFSDVSGATGLDFLEDGRAFALADFEHDGRLEVFVKNRNAPQLRVLKNVVNNLPPSIAFRLRGTGKSNRDAIGAAITVTTESGRQTRTLQAGSGFLSQHSKELFFGLGDVKGPVRASIRWPSGRVQEFRDLPINHRIWLEEGSEAVRKNSFSPSGETGSVATRIIDSHQKSTEILPENSETWLLAPLSAPDFWLRDTTGQKQNLAARRGKYVFLSFWTTESPGYRVQLETLNRIQMRVSAETLHVLAVNVDAGSDVEKLRAAVNGQLLSFPILQGSDDVAGIYNILYRQMFDRHRDMTLPTAFLINEKGEIVKVYQGTIDQEHIDQDVRRIPKTAAERLALALPFPGDADASEFRRNYLSYGSVFFQHGYFDQARVSFEQALHDDPSSAEAHYGLGSVYLKQEKREEARRSFELALRSRASYPETMPNSWNNLGLLAAKQGNTTEAIRCFHKALQISPDHLIALNNLGSAYRQQGRWNDAREVLEHAVKVSPEDAEANYNLGMVFAQLNDTQRAFEHLQKALKVRPEYPEALNNLGVLFLRVSKPDEAVEKFQECMRVAPDFDQSYLNLAKVYALENEPSKARSVLQDLLKRSPGHAQAQALLEQLGK